MTWVYIDQIEERNSHEIAIYLPLELRRASLAAAPRCVSGVAARVPLTAKPGPLLLAGGFLCFPRFSRKTAPTAFPSGPTPANTPYLQPELEVPIGRVDAQLTVTNSFESPRALSDGLVSIAL